MSRYDHAAIYDDPQLGYWDPPYATTNHVEIDESYRMKWPPGYWERYDELRETALRVSKALSAHVVMRLDGRYHVYALMSAGANLAGPTYGPVATDRHEAWENFIKKFTEDTKNINTTKNGKASINGVAGVQEFGRRFREEKRRR